MNAVSYIVPGFLLCSHLCFEEAVVQHGRKFRSVLT